MSRRTCAIALAALAVAAAGCGGGGAPRTGAGAGARTSAAPSRADFIARADRVCARYRSASRAVPTPATSAAPAEISRYLQKIVALADRTLARLHGLQPPAGDEGPVDRYLAAAAGQIALIRRAADAYASGRTADAQADIATAEQAGQDVKALAQRYGFRVCGAPQ